MAIAWSSRQSWDDVAQDIGVAALGHGVEEAAADELAAVGHARLVQRLPRALDHVRLVEQDAAEVLVLRQDRGDQPAAPAAHIDHPCHAREVIVPSDVARMGGRVAGHALVEQGRHLGVFREVVEEARAMHMVERGLAGAHAVQQVAPGLPVRFVEQEQHGRLDRARHALAQGRAQGCQRETVRVHLVEHADARERQQDAAQARACAPLARASSPISRGPSASRSGMPSAVAT
jgi:hypothetical protein